MKTGRGRLSLEFHPLTPGRWVDFEQLFGDRGACGGCWCMWWRLGSREFEAGKGEPNRKAMKKIVASGDTPGILAYNKARPVGWCAVAPRDAFPRLKGSRILRPVDDEPVWSVVCLFVDRAHRHRGVATRLLRAAVNHVRERGGKIVEGYAVEPKRDRLPDAFAFHGLIENYNKAGFREVARRSETRPIMRYSIRKRPPA